MDWRVAVLLPLEQASPLWPGSHNGITTLQRSGRGRVLVNLVNMFRYMWRRGTWGAAHLVHEVNLTVRDGISMT